MFYVKNIYIYIRINTMVDKIKDMLQRTLSFLIDSKKLFIYLTVSLIFIFFSQLFLDRPFLLLNDQAIEYHALYSEWLRLVRGFFENGSFPFYSWNTFLGTDFYSSMTFYVNGDIFLPILLLFNKIEDGLFFETILLIYISATLFKLYLKSFGVKNSTAMFVVPYVYALNGLVGLYFGNYMFHRFYAFLPLLFYGIEKYLNKRNPIVFIIAVVILYLQSFYFMFPTSMFLIIYFTFSYIYKFNEIVFRDYILKALKLIFYYLIGFGLVGFIIIPTIIYALNSPRLAEVNVFGFTWPLKVLIGMIFNLFSGPFPVYTSIPNIFQSGFDGHEYWYSFYISSVFIIFIIEYFLNRGKSKKKIFLYTYIAILIVLLFYPINRLFHAFAEPSLRLSFIFVFFMLLHVAIIIDNDEFTFKKHHRNYIVLTLIFLIFILIKLGILELPTHKYHVFFITISIINICFSYYFLIKKKFNILFIWLIIEVVFNISISNYYLNKNFYRYEPNLIQEYVDYYQEIDSDLLFRTYIDPIHFKPLSNLNLNQSLVYNYMSTSTYVSFYEPAIREFLTINDVNWHIININNPDLLKLLGVKYYIVENENEIPENVNSEFISKINYLSVYKDINSLPLGYTFSNFSNIDKKDKTNINWLNELLVKVEDLNSLANIQPSERAYLKITDRYQNGLVGSITLNSEQVLFLSIPNNKGWKIYVDEVLTTPIDVDGGFIGLRLSAGEHLLKMYFVPVGFKQGVLLSGFSGIVLVSVLIFNKIKKGKLW